MNGTKQAQLLALGQQTGNPNERTHIRMSQNSKEAIVEGIFPNKPTSAIIPFSTTEFVCFTGDCWEDCRCNACQYITDNNTVWEEQI